MPLKKSALMAVPVLALAMAGCTSERFAPMGGSRAPAPLAAAPSGTVTSNQLPPPSGPTNASNFPEPPQQDTQVAALDPNAAANAPDVSTGSVAGVWSVNVAGQSCRIATPQTKFGAGYRAGPLRCPAPMDGVKSWNVEGKQLAFYDESGGVLARLYSSGAERFDGQTTSGQPISLTR
ncbi:protease inhibitor Inh/omp19 family protein [Nitratireductor sp. ZSWI3]|uniref:protease inhibitor Inh/omp19 family protein n=1 Tax=Nitratireductor sp. ZSWI3 TaxID=2966359 RepID=UPI0021504F55|nr:protease inhibitor Inh/omp19 family protein [Nitratireductor sp. ZSWI3]MCR4266562.1 protease inhibitor Inh/omp19 family protein [Nitratireductor sp. ZSWI3]